MSKVDGSEVEGIGGSGWGKKKKKRLLLEKQELSVGAKLVLIWFLYTYISVLKVWEN